MHPMVKSKFHSHSFRVNDDDFRKCGLAFSAADLQQKNKLAPAKPHPAQVLTQGMLLHHGPDSFTTQSGADSHANICSSCASSLWSNHTPALSLADGMWIGDIPLVLHLLTLPKRILVTRYFAAAYIVKLYPMKKGACTWSIHGFHSGLQGNISTYCLNTEDIVSMTDSQIMPPHPLCIAYNCLTFGI